MFRPWNQDPRPAWQVTVTWATRRGCHDADDQRLLLKTLQETGLVRRQTLTIACGRLTLTMLVRADDCERAEHAAVRIGEVAYRVAGLGRLGMNLSSTATVHPASTSEQPA